MLPPINLGKWIKEHQHLLVPPVCNQQVYETGDFIIMVIGGPNLRKDYHDDPGDEFFYQLKGDMILRIMENHGPTAGLMQSQGRRHPERSRGISTSQGDLSTALEVTEISNRSSQPDFASALGPRDVHIKEGEIFLLPAHVHHSPQRFENTVGLVIERKRTPDEKDGFVWYCDKCHHKLHEESLRLKNIVQDLPPLFSRFWENTTARTCQKCGFVLNK